MEPEYQHKILVIDDDKQVGKAIDSISQAEKFESVFFNNGDSAIEEIKKTEKPFSLIMASQNLNGMTGTQLLENAKELTPESIRFLVTSHSELQTIINAVNKGAIQRYIAKPWEHDDLIKIIKSGIKLYELFLDNEELLNIAKKQNTKLYDLSCELMEATKSQNKTIQGLDNDIEILKKEMKNLLFKAPANLNILINKIGSYASNDQIQPLFSDTIKELYGQFKELAHQNAFEMPDIKGEIK